MPRGTYKRYDNATLETALAKIANGTISINAASVTYDIPKSTLFDRVRNNRVPGRGRQVTSAGLTEKEQADLMDWSRQMAKIGYHRTEQELIFEAKKLLMEDGRLNPFSSDSAGHEWIKQFYWQHPNLVIPCPDMLDQDAACDTLEKVHTWFSNLGEYFQGEKIEGGLQIFEDSRRIFTADESGFLLAGVKSEMLSGAFVGNGDSSDNTQINVLACANAAGAFLPPMMVFPGAGYDYNPLEGGPVGAVFGRSDNGWVDADLFFGWMVNHFFPFVAENEIPCPVVLFIDGQSTRINLETTCFCRENKIILYCLPPNSSHILLPLDVAVFCSLKKRWAADVRSYQMKNAGSQVTERTFSAVFRQSWEAAATANNAVNGFRKCGLCPLDRHAVDISKLTKAYKPAKSDHPLHEVVMNPVVPVAISEQPPGIKPPFQMALGAFETVLTPQKKALFLRLYEERFDQRDHELYCAWKVLYNAANKEATDRFVSDRHQPSSTSPQMVDIPGPSSAQQVLLNDS